MKIMLFIHSYYYPQCDSQKWISQNSTKGDLWWAGGRIPKEGATASLFRPPPLKSAGAIGQDYNKKNRIRSCKDAPEIYRLRGFGDIEITKKKPLFLLQKSKNSPFSIT